MGQFIDQCHLGVPSQDRSDIHFLEDRSPVLDRLSGNLLEIRYELLCVRASMTLDKPDDDVRTTLHPPVALVEHGVGLPDPGRGTQVDAEVPSWLDRFIMI